MNSYKLADIAKIKNGKKYSKSEGHYPVYGSNGIISYNSNYNTMENTIIIGRVGANAGSVFFTSTKCWVTDNAINVIPDVTKVNSIYLFYILTRLNLNRLSQGSAQPLLNQTIINDIHIELPSLKDQYEIVNRIILFDKKIELNNQINDNLLNLAKSYFDSLKIKKLEKLNDIVDVRDGTHASPQQVSKGFPLVTSKAIKGNIIDFSQTKLISKNDLKKINERSNVETHDILVSMIGTVGIIYRVSEKKINFGIKNVGLIKVDGNIMKSIIIYLYLLSKPGYDYIHSHLSGSTQQFISLTTLRNMPIPTLDNFSNSSLNILKKIITKIDLNSQENIILNQVKQELLNKLF